MSYKKRNCLNGETTPVSNTSTHETGNNLTTLFIECLSQLRDVQLKIRNYYENDALDKSCLETVYLDLEDSLNNAAFDIASMSGSEMLVGIFYKENNKK